MDYIVKKLTLFNVSRNEYYLGEYVELLELFQLDQEVCSKDELEKIIMDYLVHLSYLPDNPKDPMPCVKKNMTITRKKEFESSLEFRQYFKKLVNVLRSLQSQKHTTYRPIYENVLSDEPTIKAIIILMINSCYIFTF